MHISSGRTILVLIVLPIASNGEVEVNILIDICFSSPELCPLLRHFGRLDWFRLLGAMMDARQKRNLSSVGLCRGAIKANHSHLAPTAQRSALIPHMSVLPDQYAFYGQNTQQHKAVLALWHVMTWSTWQIWLHEQRLLFVARDSGAGR